MRLIVHRVALPKVAAAKVVLDRRVGLALALAALERFPANKLRLASIPLAEALKRRRGLTLLRGSTRPAVLRLIVEADSRSEFHRNTPAMSEEPAAASATFDSVTKLPTLPLKARHAERTPAATSIWYNAPQDNATSAAFPITDGYKRFRPIILSNAPQIRNLEHIPADK